MVVGLDEAGRGPLAGPVVAAAVSVKSQTSISNSQSNRKKSQTVFGITSLGIDWLSGFDYWVFSIRDSKQLSEKRREKFYKMLTSHPNISWGVGIVSEKIIDKINILEATKLAMTKAINNLNSKLRYTNHKQIQNSNVQNPKRINFLLIDGNFSINSTIPQTSIIKGDQKVFSICAAGIIAKVTRDRIMKTMHKKYPQYGFNAHKGYGTALHVANLKNFGPSKIHRKSFYPVSELV